MNPLELLFEEEGLPAFELPDELGSLYGGTLGFDEPRVFANFVSSIDGVVAVPSVPGSNKLIAGSSAADRLVMGLLRACADALMIGSGTLEASPRSVWTPEQAFPDAAAGFAELRRRLGREGNPEVVVVSASGRVDPAHPAFAAGAHLVTTDLGASRLVGELPDATTIASLGERLEANAIMASLRDRGHRLILSEGGPRAIGHLFAAGVVDELFLTTSPLLVGRPAGDQRLGLVEGVDLLPGGPLAARLTGVRRDGGHLFLRYDLT